MIDLVHSDLAGPISPVAKDGFEYAICILDDYSGMVFHYFMKHKSDTTLATAKFIADVAHIGKIKRLRTDNGGEYMEGSFKDLLVQHSINTQMSHILNIVPIGTIKMHFFIIIITPIERSLRGHKFLYY